VSDLLLVAAALDTARRDFYVDLVASADSVVAVDGGITACRWADRPPDLLVGDFDSASPDDVDWAKRAGAALERLPVRKDATDLQVGLKRSASFSGSRRVATGVLGGRLDHELASIAALFDVVHAPWVVLEPALNAWPLLGPATLTLEGEGATVSLLAWSAEVSVSARGVAYPLDREVLSRCEPRGVSNIIQAEQASLTVHSGMLLVLSPHLDFPPAIGYPQ
jgi:thiamine pyrophosphokinase